MKVWQRYIWGLVVGATSTSAMTTEEGCTHGKLFISDANSTNIKVYDVSKGISANMPVEQTIVAPGAGDGVNLDVTASGLEVAAIYRGTEPTGYTDGIVNFFRTGYKNETYEPVSIITNAEIKCSRAIHFVKHDGKIAIFCDGDYETNPNNSTVWVVDESKFGNSTTESAIIYNTTLLGSHHGVAIPVDDNHLLYSLATPDRVNRTPNGTDYSLPETFQVVDYEGKVLHSIANTSSDDTSCSGFHGSSGVGNQFALACDAIHGGILLVDYNPTASTYTSRALSYPDGYVEHRTGSFAEHHKAEYFIGNFAGTNSSHLMAFATSDTELTKNQVLSLGAARQCGFAFELGTADHVMVFMPNGMFHIFEYHDDQWEELAKVQVVEGMTACSEALFEPGYAQAFVIHKTSRSLYALDTSHVGHDGGSIDIKTTSLDFLPFDAVVAGAPDSAACTVEDDHESGAGGGTSTTAGGGTSTISASAPAMKNAILLGAVVLTSGAVTLYELLN